MPDVVHKVPLGGQLTTINVPVGATILYTTVQHDAATIWYRCDPEQPTENRYIQGFVTGAKKIPSDAVYIGTCLFDNGHLVFHIFEVFPPLNTGS